MSNKDIKPNLVRLKCLTESTPSLSQIKRKCAIQPYKSLQRKREPNNKKITKDTIDHSLSNAQQMNDYKRLMKENLELQKSFKWLCDRVNEANERTHCEIREKELLREEVNALRRKIESLTVELQETRDQNELMEFRILESEQCQRICLNGLKKEIGVNTDDWRISDTSLHSSINNEYSDDDKRMRDAKRDEPECSKDESKEKIKRMCTRKNEAHTELYGLTLSLTSEDEGLGDDGRRESSGPSSLSDHLSDEESSKKSVKCECIQRNSLLKKEINSLIEERDNLKEQVLELEEAENDSRLLSQRFQMQNQSLLNQIDRLRISLNKANQVIEDKSQSIRTLKESEVKLKVELLMALMNTKDSNSLIEQIRKELEEENVKISYLDLASFGSKSSFPSAQSLFSKSNDSLDNHDFEMYISEESMSLDPGSSFHVQSINKPKNYKRRSNRQTMPLCETVKPKKIDVYGSMGDSD